MTYHSRRRPRAKQAEALTAIREKKFFAVLMAMRTGKTKVVVDDWGRRVAENRVVDLLVIAPGGAYEPWARAVLDDLPQEIADRISIFVWRSRDAHRKKFDLDNFMIHPGPRVLIVNIEAISTIPEVRNLCVQFLGGCPGRNEIVIDESVIIKNPASGCSKFIVDRLAPLAEYRRILSGLLSPRSPLDVYQQFRFLDPGILGFSKYSEFKERYAVIRRICTLPNTVIHNKFRNIMKFRKINNLTDTELAQRMEALGMGGMPRSTMIGFLGAAEDQTRRQDMIDAIFRMGSWMKAIPVVEGYRDLDQIQRQISPHVFRAALEDCYDLPPSDWSFLDIEMTDEQERIYAEMREYATAELAKDDYVTASQVIVQILRLHQILCGHTRNEEDELRLIPENRTEALVQFLSAYDRKAIVWCSYDEDVRKVAAALEDEFGRGCTARFWGGNRKTREAEEEAFRGSPTVRWMVATPDAGGRGRAWHAADLAVYYSCRDNLDHRAQSEERLKAVGKTTPVAYVDMRVPGTVEEKIIQALRTKMNLAEAITGQNWRSWLI